MATLVDSLGQLDHAERRKFKKVFAKLSEAYVVRSPSQLNIQVADLLIEGPGNCWLLLGLHPAPPGAEELGKYQSLSTVMAQTYNTFVRYLAITEAAEAHHQNGVKLEHLVVIERQQFFSEGANLVEKYAHTVSNVAHRWLKKQVFPETSINPECSTRRRTAYRDNTAKLQPFFSRLRPRKSHQTRPHRPGCHQ